MAMTKPSKSIEARPTQDGRSVYLIVHARGQDVEMPLTFDESSDLAQTLCELTGGAHFVFWSEKTTASVLNFAPKTLANDRVTGRLGIPFHKFGGAVRYRSDEVLVWAAERRRKSPADRGPADDVT